MPGSLWNESDRQRLLARLERLHPDARPLWGSMNAMQMITQLTEWMRMATGELESAPLRRLSSFGELKSTARWPVHPAFGNISTNAWGVLGYRHTDHHLRQFGV